MRLRRDALRRTAGRIARGSWAIAGAVFLLISGCDSIFGSGSTPTTITVSPSTIVFDAVGDTRLLNAEVFDQDGAGMPDARVTWRSSNSSVAEVSGSGLVTSTGNGSAYVYASIGSVTGEVAATVAQTPAGLSAVGGDRQEGAAGELLPTDLEVLVTDRLGSPAAGTEILFQATGGGGSPSWTSVLSGSDGLASTGWKLGEVAGITQALEARVSGSDELAVAFSATAVAGPPHAIRKEDGDDQAAQRQTQLPGELTVSVVDRFDNPIEGAVVTWTALTGGGSVNPVTGLTEGSGQSSSTWVLGTELGTQEAAAATPGVQGPAVFIATALAVPADIDVAEGDAQTGTVGAALPLSPTILLLDGQGLPVPSTPVRFTVTAGGGSLDPGSVGEAGAGAPTRDVSTGVSTIVVETNAQGRASAPPWTLGTTAGENRLRASVDGLDPVVFSANGLPGPAAILEKVSGDAQEATVGTMLPSPLVVRVTDLYGNAVAGTLVQFVAGVGFGSTSPTLTSSQADGTALSAWTLGSAIGDQQALASFSAASQVVFTATGLAVGGGGGGGAGGGGGGVDDADFDIVFDYVNPVAPEVEQVFDAAASRWSQIITGDLPAITFTVGAGNCDNPTAVGGTFDDLYIMVTIEPIDGEGTILGSAGPCYLRSSSLLPFFGTVHLDEADVNSLLASGRLEDVILHEIGHVIGIGTLWSSLGLLADPATPGDPDPPDTHFTGTAAASAFDAVGGASYPDAKVPVENEQGGLGTLNGHWRESVFGTELMTGFISGTSNPLSRVTAASLTDIGYEVNEGAADSYSLAAGAPPLFAPSEAVPIDEILRGPIGTVDSSGAVTPAPPR